MNQHRFSAVAYSPKAKPIRLYADTLRGLRLAASNRGCTVVAAREMFDGGEWRYWLTERGWVEVSREDVELMRRMWT